MLAFRPLAFKECMLLRLCCEAHVIAKSIAYTSYLRNSFEIAQNDTNESSGNKSISVLLLKHLLSQTQALPTLQEFRELLLVMTGQTLP